MVYDRLKESRFYEKVDEFFGVRDVQHYSEVHPRDGVSPAELSSSESVSLSHVYNNVLSGMVKEEGTVKPTSFLITFDQRVFNINDESRETKRCSTTNIIYEHVLLGESPVLYYFYLNPQYVIDISRELH
ncbi:hypothetical protein GGQ06_001763 [Salinibacter ruber]|nr:hypothetical protein [Salinibacter ruber]